MGLEFAGRGRMLSLGFDSSLLYLAVKVLVMVSLLVWVRGSLAKLMAGLTVGLL